MTERKGQQIRYYFRDQKPTDSDEASDDVEDREKIDEHISDDQSADEDSDFDESPSRSQDFDSDDEELESELQQRNLKPPLESWSLLFADSMIEIVVLHTNEEINRKLYTTQNPDFYMKTIRLS